MKKKDIIEGKIIKTEFPNKEHLSAKIRKLQSKVSLMGRRSKGRLPRREKVAVW